MKAVAIEAIDIIQQSKIGPVFVLETSCRDYEHYSNLPVAVSYNCRVYVKTGWSSDTYRACYKTGVPYAVPIG